MAIGPQPATRPNSVKEAFGRELRRLRLKKGMSQAALGAQVHVDKSVISYAETGRRQLSRGHAEACDRVLEAGGALIALIPRTDTKRGTRSSARPVPRHLPGADGYLCGRAEELKVLNSLRAPSGSVRICVVAGTAGVGKTTLAVWWAHRVEKSFPDGTLFADLMDHGQRRPLDPSHALMAFLQAFGVLPGDIPVGLDAQVGLYRSLLSGRQVLVLLDNAVSEEQVRPLLPVSAGSLALITSQAALSGLIVTGGARLLPLKRLTPDGARELLRNTIGAAPVDIERDAATKLIELCARLPLALRIAAAKLAVGTASSIAELVAEIAPLGDRLAALRVGDDEHGAVTPVLTASYARLAPPVARLFRRLGPHPNPEFTVAAAAAFAGLTPVEASRALDALVRAHLVELAGPGRYRLHDLLHVFAAQQVEVDEPAEQRAAAERAGLAWYAAAALAADRLIFPAHPEPPVPQEIPEGLDQPADRAAAWDWFTTERPTLLAALRRASDLGAHPTVTALATAMRFLAFAPRGLWTLRLEAESLGLTAARALGDPVAEMTLLRRRADTFQMCGQWPESEADLRTCVALAEQGGNPVLLGQALCGLGRARKLRGKLAEALSYYLEAVPLVRGSDYDEAVTECNLSQINAQLGRFPDALVHAESEWNLRRDRGDPAGEGYALHDLAVARQGLGDHAAAIEAGERAAALLRNTTATGAYLADVLRTLASSYAAAEDATSAARCRREAADLLAELEESW